MFSTSIYFFIDSMMCWLKDDTKTQAFHAHFFHMCYIRSLLGYFLMKNLKSKINININIMQHTM